MKQIRILIADDHPLFLKGLNTVLTLEDAELKVVGVATNGKEAVKKAQEVSPDIVLLDIRMPIMDGVLATKLIRNQNPDVKIIILTTFDDKELVSSALEAGASGYILKDTPIEKIIADIKFVDQGNVLISQQAAKKLIGMQEKRLITAKEKEPQKSRCPDELDEFTNREREVFKFMISGKDNLQIAEELGLSEKTVRNYVSQIYDILGIHNRTKIILWSLEHGLI